MVCDYDVIERLMIAKGVKAADVSKAANIDPATFTNWKKKEGGYRPKLEKLERIAKYFGVPLETFVKE